MNKAYLIDATAREVREVEYHNWRDIRRLVGGTFAIARTWNDGDTLFVDDEGLFKRQTGYFRIPDVSQPLAGNGLLVGREIDEDGNTAPPSFTLDEVRAMIRFLTPNEFQSWIKGNASEPMASISYITKDGRVVTEVLSTWRDFED